MINQGQTGFGWQKSSKYSTKVINEIDDNSDGTFKIVNKNYSVPSPFARIYLMRQAFEYVNNLNDLDGTSIYHFLVSQCLDVFELLFNKDAIKSNISIGQWAIEQELSKLTKDNNFPGQQLLGNILGIYRTDTLLEKFFVGTSGKDDSQSQEPIENIFFILVDNQVVAGTCPYSVFFTAPDNLPDANMGFFQMENEGGNPRPLYKRDTYFQAYMHGLRESNLTSFFQNFRPLSDYLVLNQEKVGITGTKLAEFKDYFKNEVEPLLLNEGNPLTIYGIQIGKKSLNIRRNKIQSISDFIISTRKDYQEYYPGEYIPMALVNKFRDSWVYTDDNVNWNPNYSIDRSQLSIPLHERTLPGSITYPFVTVDDFLEDSLILLPFDINKDRFHTGKFINETRNSFLPPIKKEYFRYFPVESIDENLSFEDFGNQGFIRVTLKILLRNGEFMIF